MNFHLPGSTQKYQHRYMFCWCHDLPWNQTSGIIYITWFGLVSSRFVEIYCYNTDRQPSYFLMIKLKVNQSKNKSASAPSVYCFNHIHLDTATINKLPWERYTACIQAQTSLLSVFFWYIILKQLLFLSAFGCGFNLHPEEKVQTILLNEQTFLAGFCFSYIWKDDRPNSGKKKGKKWTPSKNKSVTTTNVECQFSY